MTLTLELSPDQEQRLRERAARAGLDPVTYVQHLIDDEPIGSDDINDSIGRLMAKIGRPAPAIDLSREGIYADF